MFDGLRVSALDADSTERYSRQLLIPDIGVEGQKAICETRVLVVGAGGLGSPVCLYLATAGIGTIGIVDYDVVDLSNLHRQIIHCEASVGRKKVNSAADRIKSINSRVNVKAFDEAFTRNNAFDIVKDFDIVVDASDNPPTRYLINDVCVLLGKPLVSASAIRMEGQLTVYNFNGGPCYRCLFPIPPPKGTVSNCEDGGVVGCVVGVLGSLQAMEALKIAILLKHPEKPFQTYAQKLLIYNAFSCSFRTVTLRNKSPTCDACCDTPRITKDLLDYEVFCQSMACEKAPAVKLLGPSERIDCKEYHQVLRNGERHLLIDVRQRNQFDICSLPNSLHVPLEQLDAEIHKIKEELEKFEESTNVYVICRRGNRSQHAVKILEKYDIVSKDIIGGLCKWKMEVDEEFPMY